MSVSIKKRKQLDSEILNIINQCRKDNRKAQNQLYMQYYSFSLSVCTRYVTDLSDAKSVMNQGFFKVFKNLDKYKDEYAFKPWLKTIMVNTALDHIKMNKKHAYNAELNHSHDRASNENILDKLNYDDLIKVVNQLPTSYRTVFNLFVIDGYKHEEIAERLGIGIGTSKSNLSRAKEKLRSLVREKLMIA